MKGGRVDRKTKHRNTDFSLGSSPFVLVSTSGPMSVKETSRKDGQTGETERKRGGRSGRRGLWGKRKRHDCNRCRRLVKGERDIQTSVDSSQTRLRSRRDTPYSVSCQTLLELTPEWSQGVGDFEHCIIIGIPYKSTGEGSCWRHDYGLTEVTHPSIVQTSGLFVPINRRDLYLLQ